MTLIIDNQSDPGSYADKFKDAPFYHAGQRWTADELVAIYRDTTPARCYRDRKVHDKLIARTNELRAIVGMEPL